MAEEQRHLDLTPGPETKSSCFPALFSPARCSALPVRPERPQAWGKIHLDWLRRLALPQTHRLLWGTKEIEITKVAAGAVAIAP